MPNSIAEAPTLLNEDYVFTSDITYSTAEDWEIQSKHRATFNSSEAVTSQVVTYEGRMDNYYFAPTPQTNTIRYNYLTFSDLTPSIQLTKTEYEQHLLDLKQQFDDDDLADYESGK